MLKEPALVGSFFVPNAKENQQAPSSEKDLNNKEAYNLALAIIFGIASVTGF